MRQANHARTRRAWNHALSQARLSLSLLGLRRRRWGVLFLASSSLDPGRHVPSAVLIQILQALPWAVPVQAEGP